jgi:sigma-B regulation protein RsbU (phosphoserine phosphatase)
MEERDKEYIEPLAAADTQSDAVAVELTAEPAPTPVPIEETAPPRRVELFRDFSGHLLLVVLCSSTCLCALLAWQLQRAGLGDRIPHLYSRLAMVTLLITTAAWGISYWWTRRRLRPLRALTKAAQSADRGELTARVPIAFKDEVGELTRIFESMRASVSRRESLMRRMQESFVRISRHLDGEDLHEQLVAMFTAIAETPAGRLFITDENDKLIMRHETAGDTMPPPGSDGIVSAAFDERWDQMLRENGRLTSHADEAVDVAIPLLSGTHRNGVIRLGRRRNGGTYNDDTLAVLHSLAQFASVAIENATLYGQLAARQRLEQEMLWARNIQEAMWPQALPDIPGYDLYGKSLPANEVGGDYFDYVASEHAWHVLIGDVSGKGVPAALIMTIVRSLLRTYLQFDSSPYRVLNSVNRSLSPDLEADMFVTLSALRLEPTRHVIRVARAGHEPVLLVRTSGEVELVAPRGAAVGLVDGTRFRDLMEEVEVPIAQGETLVLYTDGVTEAQNPHAEEFGSERLAALLSAHAGLPARDLYGKIMQALEAFSDGAARTDDITVVVLRRNGA